MRQRRLTLPLPPQSSSMLVTQLKTNEQVQSLFFFRLPVEIRTIIYEKVLGGEGRLLHIVRPTEGCFSHIRCTSLDRKCKNYECFQTWTPEVEDPKRLGTFHKTHGHLLPLLKSCRKAYIQAIDVLYSVNVFEFRNHYPFIYFPTTILPARLRQIRSLHFTFRIGPELDYITGTRSTGGSGGAVAWKKTWEIVAEMSGLRNLQVDLFKLLDTELLEGSQMDQLLLPFMTVKHMDRFIVGIGWTVPNDYYMTDSSKKPFQVVELSEKIAEQ